MAHYAFLDTNNIVTEVITGRNEDEIVDGISDWEIYYGNFREQKCVRTSYNGNIRKNFAAIGMHYDLVKDAFIPLKPFPSWVLNEDICIWEPPIPKPDASIAWQWDEENIQWVEPPTPQE